MAMYNDGTKAFDHQRYKKCAFSFWNLCVKEWNLHFFFLSDGVAQQIAGCQRDFRNKPFPVRAKIEYYKNVLTVSKSSFTVF